MDGRPSSGLSFGGMNLARTRTVARFRLVLLATACVLMALAFVVVFVLDHAAEGRAALEQKAETLARSSATAIDRQLAAAEALLTGLTVSSALDIGDIAAFHAQAVAVAKPPGTWLILLDREGRQLANTLRPYGALLPDLSEVNKRIVSAIVQNRRTSITNLSQSPITGETGIALGIPVIRDRAVAYVLAIAISGDRLAGMLDPDRLPFGWSIALLDSLGNTIAQHSTEGPGDKITNERDFPTGSTGRRQAAPWP